MRVGGVKFGEVDGRLRGRVVIYDQKTMASGFVYIGHDAARALKRSMLMIRMNWPIDTRNTIDEVPYLVLEQEIPGQNQLLLTIRKRRVVGLTPMGGY